MTSAASGLRERKRAETLAAIQRAAVELTHEVGYENASVEAICERAGVSPRTFFNYVGTKETAVIGTAFAHLSEHEWMRVRDGDGDVLSDLLELLERVRTDLTADAELTAKRKQAVAENPHLLQAMFNRMHEYEGELREALVERLAGRDGTSVDDPAIVAAAMMYAQLANALMRYAASQVLAGRPETEFGALLDEGRRLAARLTAPA